MRIVGEVSHPDCKITLFAWNLKYLIKLERGPIEQTFKVSEMDVTGEDDIKKILEGKFLDQAIARFEEMEASLAEALGNV